MVRVTLTATDPRHGTTAGHAAGCRLLCCRAARNADERQRRKRRQVLGIVRTVPAVGTQRRIRALMALGWTSADLARSCGWKTSQAVTELLTARKWVHVGTAETVARVYDELCMTPGPSVVGRRRAAAKGWPTPLAWDEGAIDDPKARPHGNTRGRRELDESVVDRLLHGEQVHSNQTEKTEAMRRWLASGRSEKSLCTIHGWKPGRYVTHSQPDETRQDGAA